MATCEKSGRRVVVAPATMRHTHSSLNLARHLLHFALERVDVCCSRALSRGENTDEAADRSRLCNGGAMKQLLCAMAVGAIALSVVLAEDSTVSDLKAQRTGLESKKKELQTQYGKARADLFASDAFAKEKASIEKAEKAFLEKKQTDKDLSKAHAGVAAAQQELTKVIEKKVSATTEVQSAVKEVAELESKVPELQFKKRLLQINLNHEGSPIQLDLAEEKAVIAARDAVAEAEQAAKANPSAQVMAARTALAKTDESFRKAQQEIAGERNMRKASEAVAEAHAALREAESTDKGRIAAAKMREDMAKVRQEALQRISEAKTYLKELEEIAAKKKEQDSLRRDVAYIMDVNRKAIREGKDRDVVKAAEAVAKARKALDAAADSRDIAKAKKAVEEADKAYKENHDKLFGNIPEYQQLTAREDELRKKLTAMDKDVLDATSVRSIKTLIPELRKIRQDLGETAMKKRDIRMSIGKEKWDAIYAAPGVAGRAVKAAIAASPEAAAAAAAFDAAEAAFSKAVDAALATTKSGAACMDVQKDLALDAKKLAFQEAIAAHYLNDSDSTIRIALEKNSKLVKAKDDLQKEEQDLRAKPSSAIAKARKAAEEAQTEANQVRAKLEQDDYKKAAAARQAAEQEVRKAEAADPAKVKIETAKNALEQKRAETLAGMKAAKKIMDEIKQLDDELAALQTAKAKTADAQKQARAKIEKTEDKDIAAAKKGIEEAKAAVKKAEEGKAFQELQKNILDAKAALEEAKKNAETKDKGLLALKKQIAETAAQIEATSGKIKDAEKKASEVEKQEAKKVSEKTAEAKPSDAAKK